MRSAWLALALVACGGRGMPPATRAQGDVALSYEVALDPALETMRVTLCPRGATLPDALVPVHDEARRHIHDPVLVDGGAIVRALPVTSQQMELGDRPPGACVRYDVDLTTCTSPRGPTSCARVGRDLFAPTSAWLLAPAVRWRAARYDLRFRLPEGIHVTPITDTTSADPAVVTLDERSFEFVTYLAFVHEAPRAIAVPGGCMDVATLDGELDATFDQRTHWLSVAASASSRVTGEAPFSRMTALVVPASDVPDMPVLFGVAGRGMRPTVTLLLGAHATEAQLVPDWTAVHELSHLLTAYVDGEDTWLSEGLATYYEEVLRAREGLITEEQAWAQLVRGFARGRAESGSGTLRSASETMHTSHAYTRVYWQGAALVLLADVAYRRAGDSLDGAIARAWARRTERTTAAQLLAWLDGEPDGTFATIVAGSLDAEAFPDVVAALAWLGVVDENGTISLHQDAPGAAARVALMNGDGRFASNPPSCE